MSLFGESIPSACEARWLQHRNEARNLVRDQQDAIERAAAPVTLSDEEAQRPFAVPLGHVAIDVWQLIIDEVTDAQELFKLWEVCPLFQEILSFERKYLQARLPQVVKIILDKRPWFLLNDDDQGTPGSMRAQQARSFSEFNPTVRNLRMLSRTCKKALDDLLEPIKLYCDLSRVPDVKAIHNKILKRVYNPYFRVLRCVHVNDGLLADGEKEAFYEAVGSFLRLLGKSVRSLWYTSNRRPQDVYDKLKDMVMHPPELESLMLSLEFDNDGPAQTSFEDLLAFPTCPKLQSFVQTGKYLPRDLLQRIIDASPSLETLGAMSSYNGEQLEGLIHPPEMNVKLPKLKLLRTPMHAALLRHIGLKLPLKCIIFQEHETARRFTTLGVFTFLSQFKDTLERLELLADVWHEGNSFLKLPRLKVFKWQCNQSFKDIRFLLHAENLEEIQAEVHHHANDGMSFASWFLSNVKEGFEGCTMWQVFRRLKMLQLSFPLLTRDGTMPIVICKRA